MEHSNNFMTCNPIKEKKEEELENGKLKRDYE